MKVIVSKAFANYINKVAKELGFKAEASVVTMSAHTYKMNVSMDLYEAEEHGDYDWREGEYKAIRIEYPDDYFACPKYLTTQELTYEYRRRGVTDESDLKHMIEDLCRI